MDKIKSIEEFEKELEKELIKILDSEEAKQDPPLMSEE